MSRKQKEAEYFMIVIDENVYNEIFSLCNDSRNEVGGMIGSTHNGIIDTLYVDKTENASKSYYCPDVFVLNKVLNEWSEKNILFAGMFHSHYYGQRELSEYDKNYIYRLLEKSDLSDTGSLFPVVVFPDNELIIYKVFIVNDTVKINKELYAIKRRRCQNEQRE